MDDLIMDLLEATSLDQVQLWYTGGQDGQDTRGALEEAD